jgi:hypothetical protein
MLRAECRGQPNVAECGQCIERMAEIACQGSWMRQQGYAPPSKGLAQLSLIEEPVESKLHGNSCKETP